MIRNLFKPSKREVVDAFRDPNANLISFESLRTFKVGEVVDMIEDEPDAVLCTRLPSIDETKSLSFRVEMKRGYKWNPHFHDCWEVIVVYRGVCQDLISNKIASPGKQIIIRPGVIHEVECLTGESIFYVEFYK